MEQEVIPAKGHGMKEIPAVKPTVDAEGNIAYFLATETSQNMTGSVVVVDGGMDCLIAGGY